MNTKVLPNRIAYETIRQVHQCIPERIRWRYTRSMRSVARRLAKPLPPQIVRCRQGFRMKVTMDDWIGLHIAFEGTYESGLATLLEQLLSEDSHFVDVGANIGYFTLLAATKISNRGRVSAIEAIPQNAAELRNNVQLNGFENKVQIHEIAAWSKEELLEFNVPPPGKAGMASVRAVSNSTSTCQVSAKRLDAVIPYTEYPVSVMKFDVEGAEKEAILGASEILSQQRPIVFLELTQKYLEQLGTSSEVLVKLLQSEFNYDIFLYDEAGALAPLLADHISASAGEFQHNVLCFPRESSGSLLEKLNAATANGVQR